ncbi:MAG: hypothetical protein LBN38_00700 [Verrucomicrobiota bacterium]|jgi:hypothetical protein|nr:hypothetical protein [Verrucomicrobiota bacterium]
MKKMHTVIMIMPLFAVVMALATEEGNKADSVKNSTNRAVQLEGFTRSTQVISLDQSTEAKIASVVPRMRKVREVGETVGAPQTIEEATDFLRKHVSMAFPPAVCTEREGVFYFSGGRSASRIKDFSSGFAIVKGQRTIYSWDKVVGDAGKEGDRGSRP